MWGQTEMLQQEWGWTEKLQLDWGWTEKRQVQLTVAGVAAILLDPVEAVETGKPNLQRTSKRTQVSVKLITSNAYKYISTHMNTLTERCALLKTIHFASVVCTPEPNDSVCWLGKEKNLCKQRNKCGGWGVISDFGSWQH